MAHVTDLGFTLDDLLSAIVQGDVRSQSHPEFPELSIFNYTEEVQFRNRWNKITLACRGLILNNQTGEVVARPWEKFFNFGQMDNRIAMNAPVEVTDKMDGSLGILYTRPDGKYAIATRGSFASEQAIHATELWHAKYDTYRPYDTPIIPGYTYLFEIVYPENRIVVNYGDMDDLVLLGGVDMERGHYIGPGVASAYLDWAGPVTESFKYETFLDAISAPDRQGKEGYVIRSGRNIVKLKQADYVELHRIVTNLSPKTVWEMVSAGKSAEEICVDLPDEFHKYVTDIVSDLTSKFLDIKVDARTSFLGIKYKLWKGEGDTISRRKWAEEIKKSKYPGLLFMMLDDKPVNETIWKMVKPRGDVKSLVSDEG